MIYNKYWRYKMIEKITNHDEIIRILKMDKPYFNEHDFLEILKLKFATIYRSLKTNRTNLFNEYFTDDFYVSLLKNKQKIFMLNDDIDFVSIQRCMVREYSQTDTTIELKVEMFLFYIDYMSNNKENYDKTKKRYFDKAYRLTIVVPFDEKSKKNETTCPKCGGHLKKNLIKRCFVCNYCQYERFIDYDDWKISNIEQI